jgi:two-component system, OmpR family, sensor histidine kinase KdpD
MVDPDARPDPDTLLALIQSDEERRKKGRLKIFLGYAAGVGKTYEMLKAAHMRQDEGIDVRIGYVETHGRAETEALTIGLPLIPRKEILYKTTTLNEMDLDAILAGRPELVLVDELAHSNPPDTRHSKRYLDIEEILLAGIDVYTTLNIQHLDSVRDVVARITSVMVRETVPDRVLDEADEIELMDLPPPELLQRLSEGKVYVPDMASLAVEKFFNEGNLYALRELSLRKTAERVDTQMQAYMQTRSIPGPWSVTEHLLVSIGPSPLSERLVRNARRQADRMNTDWRAVYVETPAHYRLSKRSKEQIWKTIKLADSLGGRTETIFGLSVPDTLIDYAKKHNITRIIIGKTLRPRWKEIVFGSIVDQMIHKSGDIDVYVISSGEETVKTPPASEEPFFPPIPPVQYLESLLLVGVVTALGEVTKTFISQANLLMIFLMAVVIAAFRRGLYLAIFTAFVSVLAFDFFMVPPYYTLRVSDTEYLITFAGMILVGVAISLLISKAQDYAISAHTREKENAMLYNLAKKLTGALDLSTVISVIISGIKENFGWQAVILLPHEHALTVKGISEGLLVDEKEKAVAMWAYTNNAIVGYDTDTLHASRFRFIPIQSRHGVLGVLGVKPEEPGGAISPDEGRVLEIFADLAALAIERFSM